MSTYTIHRDDTVYKTQDAKLAEHMSKQGHRVTATCP